MAGPGKPGRSKGLPKTGGRQKGGIDKIKREAILAAQGITPLDYLMALVRAETEPGLDPAVARARETLRFEAAKAGGRAGCPPGASGRAQEEVSEAAIPQNQGGAPRHPAQ